jgi:DNA-binding XRE family transcriptional regulator
MLVKTFSCVYLTNCLRYYTNPLIFGYYPFMTEREKELLYLRIAENIKKYREKQKIKQGDFSKLLDISRASVVNIEKARQHPPLHLLIDISRVLKVSVHDLIPSADDLRLNDQKQISDKIQSYLSKWITRQDPADSGNTLNKIETFIKEIKS